MTGAMATHRRRMTVAFRATVVVIFTFLAAACSSTDADPAAGPVAVYQKNDNPDGFGALLQGQLQLREGCVIFESASGNVVPVFPDDAAWDGDSESIRLADGVTTLRMDEEIELGGGEVEDPTDSMSIPAGCPDDLPYFVVAP